MTRALLAAVGLTVALPGAAHATDYGGGTTPDGVARADRQLTLVTIRTLDDGTARVAVKVAAGCGVGKAVRRVQVAADGKFSFAAATRRRVGGVRQTSEIALLGQVGGAAASGGVTARLTFRRGGRVVEHCNSGPRAWQVRAAAAEPTAAPPHPGGAYHGLAGQNGRPYALVLRVDASGARVRMAAFEYRMRCRRRPFAWENITPGAPIGPDGSFALRERFTSRWAEGRERFRVKVDGRFTTTGVSGTLSVSSVLRSGSGRVTDRCTTGSRTFAALL